VRYLKPRMGERGEHDSRRDDTGPVPALVEAQLETARAEVFRAYVRSRAKARELADDEQRDHRDPPNGT
jgi:hypothetical protein